MKNARKWVIIIVVSQFLSVESDRTKVTLELANGTKIFGAKLQTIFEKKPYYGFYNIAYAEPPVGELRFKPPRPCAPHSADHPLDYSTPHSTPPSTENCLYLDLYTPRLDKTARLPLIVSLYVQQQLGPDFLIDDDVIVINVNYRRGPFGFLNVGNEIALGNMGAKDVVEALRWIRDNVRPFGGDPDNVTVLGSGGAGQAAIASLLPLTGSAIGLYAKVIAHGESPMSPDIFRLDPRKTSERLRKNLKNILTCKVPGSALSNATAAQIMLAAENIYDSTEIRDDQRLINPFSPSVEVEKEGAFIHQNPNEIYQEMSVQSTPMMLGYANLEALHKISGLVQNPKLLPCLNYNFQYVLPFNGKSDTFNSKRYQKIARRIVDFYFANGTITSKSLKRYVNYISDQIIYPLYELARLHTSVGATVYMYRISFEGKCNFSRLRAIGSRNTPRGATAGDEICYLFKCALAEDVYANPETLSERIFVKKIVRLWTNFAKYGTPTPPVDCDILGNLIWDPLVQGSEPRVLKLGKRIEMASIPELERMKFWDKLKKEFFQEKTSRIRNEL